MTTLIDPSSRRYTRHTVRLRSLLAVRQHAVIKPLIREGIRALRDVKRIAKNTQGTP